MKTRTDRRTQKTSSARKTSRKSSRSSSRPRPSRKATTAARNPPANGPKNGLVRRSAAVAPSAPLLLVHEGQVLGGLELTEPQVDQLCRQAERLLIGPEEWAAWLLAAAGSPGPVSGPLPVVQRVPVEVGESGEEPFCVPAHPRVAQLLAAKETPEARAVLLRSMHSVLDQFLTPLMTWRLIEARRSLETPPEIEAYALDQLRGLHELLEPEEQRALEELALHELKELEAFEEEEAKAELEQLVKVKRAAEAGPAAPPSDPPLAPKPAREPGQEGAKDFRTWAPNRTAPHTAALTFHLYGDRVVPDLAPLTFSAAESGCLQRQADVAQCTVGAWVSALLDVLVTGEPRLSLVSAHDAVWGRPDAEGQVQVRVTEGTAGRLRLEDLPGLRTELLALATPLYTMEALDCTNWPSEALAAHIAQLRWTVNRLPAELARQWREEAAREMVLVDAEQYDQLVVRGPGGQEPHATEDSVSPAGEPAGAPASEAKQETVYSPELVQGRLLYAAAALSGLIELLDGVTGGLVSRAPELVRQGGEGSGEGEGKAYPPAA